MSSLFHALKGRYDPRASQILIDLNTLDPMAASSIWAHEVTHGVIEVSTDFGQAASAIINQADCFQHLTGTEKDEITGLIFNAHKTVQESFATYMQIVFIVLHKSKPEAIRWADQNLTQYYKDMFNKLAFVLDMSQTNRDYFTKKIPSISLETGIRKMLPKIDGLKTAQSLADYLNDSNNNPDIRFEKIIGVLKYKPWLVSKPIKEIAAQCGINFNPASTKQEVADFLTYLSNLTRNPKKFRKEEIGNAPRGLEAFNKTGENIVVTNLNLNLQESEIIFDLNNFLFYANEIEALFVNLHDSTFKHNQIIRAITGKDPEIAMVAFRKTGEKYMTVTTKAEAEQILNNQLSCPTLAVKWGGYDLEKNCQIWSSSVRPPDVVIYNTINDLRSYFLKYLANHSESKLYILHAGITQKNMLQTLIIRVGQIPTFHILNAFGNKGIGSFLKDNSSKIIRLSDQDLRSHKKQINNFLGIMNFGWEIDWVETMIDGRSIHLRT